MKFNFLSKNKATAGQDQSFLTDKETVIRRATESTLDQFAKTFEDLARYDRTEKANNPLSR